MTPRSKQKLSALARAQARTRVIFT